MRLREVTVAANAVTLRHLANFSLQVATEIDEHGDRFGHAHFEDYDGWAQGMPQFVVSCPTTRGGGSDS